MKYERLTKYDEQGIVRYIRCDEYPNKGCYGECGSCGVQIKGKQRLAELEDKIEAGTLAEVGKLFIEYDEIGGGYLICKYGKQSKGVEFTREAAEKRLKELRGER